MQRSDDLMVLEATRSTRVMAMYERLERMCRMTFPRLDPIVAYNVVTLAHWVTLPLMRPQAVSLLKSIEATVPKELFATLIVFMDAARNDVHRMQLANAMDMEAELTSDLSRWE